MSVARMTFQTMTFSGTPPQTYTWTAPAGVTVVIVQIQNSSTAAANSARIVSVVPGTTYTITVKSKTSLSAGNENSFDTLFTFDSGSIAYLNWIE